MREVTDRGRLAGFMRALGRTNARGRVYLTGGASALLLGWRSTTIDVDLKFEPEADELFRAVQELKESLNVNVELACPADFIPEIPGWRDHSPFIVAEGALSFHHYDFRAQALSKIERGHDRDLLDVKEMLARGLITADSLRAAFDAIEPDLFRYPSVDPGSFRASLSKALQSS